uniref:Uncharacterized protein n=1 Tax=Romanomermis culicivorax TaxID=13658 RepID=A0A915I8K8_ROMCU
MLRTYLIGNSVIFCEATFAATPTAPSIISEWIEYADAGIDKTIYRRGTFSCGNSDMGQVM